MVVGARVSVVSAAVLTLAGVGVATSWPVTERGYASEVSATAQQALDAAGTAILVGRAQLAGDALHSYASVAMAEVRESAAQAVELQLAAEIPGPSARGLDDELKPLLIDTAHAISVLEEALDAGDVPGAEAALDQLEPVRSALSAFVEQTR